MKTFTNIVRGITVLACVIAVFGFISDMSNATSAPQQAVAGAVYAAMVVIPYVTMRALEGFCGKEV